MRTKLFLTVAMVASLATTGLLAEAVEPRREVTVTGEGQLDLAPDQAVITLGVTHHDPEAANAMRAVSADMTEVVAQLRALGIEGRDLQTRQISLHPVWSTKGSYDGGDGRRITGFQASNTLMLRLGDLDQLGQVLDQVLQSGANQFQGLRFSISDPEAVETELRTAAMEDAFAKASQLAQAAGMALGPVRLITDHGQGGGRPVMAMEMARSTAMPIEAGELSYSYSVQVVFDLIEQK